MTEIKEKSYHKPEFSRPIAVDDLSEEGQLIKLKALKGECAALAKRFKVQEIQYIKAEFSLNKTSDNKILMTGYFTSKVEQTCVVSLETVVSHIKVEIDIAFCDEKEIARRDEARKKQIKAEEEQKILQKKGAKPKQYNSFSEEEGDDDDDIRSRKKRHRRMKKEQIAEAVSDDLFDDDGFLAMSFDAEELEPITGGQIDLGEVIAQLLAVEIDPYPRKSGAVFVDVSPNKHAGESGETTSENPFAILASLKNKKN